MPDLQVFQYLHTPIRLQLDVNNCPWWVAQDVAGALSIANVRKRLARFPDDEKGVAQGYTLGGTQEVLTVNEPGLYRLIFASRTAEAEAFKHWVFHEVLPSIRQTGAYQISTLQAELATLRQDHATLRESVPAKYTHGPASGLWKKYAREIAAFLDARDTFQFGEFLAALGLPVRDNRHALALRWKLLHHGWAPSIPRTLSLLQQANGMPLVTQEWMFTGWCLGRAKRISRNVARAESRVAAHAR
jgi:prophage antirepressor-like protein